jgi:hypothetical protein
MGQHTPPPRFWPLPNATLQFRGLAAMQLYLHRNWGEAERAFIHALTLDPDDGETRNHYSFSLALFGRFEEAIAHVRRAIELDPLSVRFQWNLGTMYYQSGRYDDTIEQCRGTLSLDPMYLHAHALMGDAYEQKGEPDEAAQHWQRAGIGYHDGDNATVERLWRGRLDALTNRIGVGEFVPAMDMARAHARLGNVDAMIEWLTRALHERSRLVLEVPVDLLFNPFRRDPRFDSIVAALPNGQIGRPPRPPSLRPASESAGTASNTTAAMKCEVGQDGCTRPSTNAGCFSSSWRFSLSRCSKRRK